MRTAPACSPAHGQTPCSSTRWFCTGGMSGPGNTPTSQPGRDSPELPCSGVAGESHLVAPAALPAFLLFFPGTPRPLVRPGDRRPRGRRCSPGRAAGSTRAGRYSQLHLGDMSHKTDVPSVHMCAAGAWMGPQPLDWLPQTVSALPDHHCSPALSGSCPIAALLGSPSGKGVEPARAGHLGEHLALGRCSHMRGTHLCLYVTLVCCYGTSLRSLCSQFFFICLIFVHKPAKKKKVPVVSIRGNTVPCSPMEKLLPELSCSQASSPEKQNT